MILKVFEVGALGVNCTILGDDMSLEAMVLDPGDEPDIIIDYIEAHGLKIKYIVLTHAHFDHVGAVPEIAESTRAPVAIHEDELEIYDEASNQASFWGYEIPPLPEPEALLKEGDVLELGNLSFTVLHTPGHSPGGICLYGEGLLISGDTLFRGSVGRTDFYGGDVGRLRKSIEKLMSLPDETVVICGHGPSTTIGAEKADNFFINQIEI